MPRLALAASFAAVLAVTAAAAPAPASLRDQIVADAKAWPASRIAYERTVKASQSDGKETETKVRVDRWDGRAWSLISVDSRPASPGEAADSAKAAAKLPVPGYHRLADYLAAGAQQVTTADGRTLLKIPQLPKGSVVGDTGDLSEHFSGEALVVDASGPRPWVQRLHLVAREPFHIRMVFKVDTFDVTVDYRLGPGGRPEVVRSQNTVNGAMFGRSGTQRTEASFVYR
jgi:hypothetical protein